MVEIRPDMVGKRLPIATGVELKTGKQTLTDKQRAALDYLGSINGIAGMARSVDDYKRILREWNERFEEEGERRPS